MFQLEIPAIMNVMSALALSLMVGLAITWTKSKMMESLLDEVQNIVQICIRDRYKIIPVAIRLHSWKWVKKVTRPDTAEG